MRLDEILNKPSPFEVAENTDSFWQAEFNAGNRKIVFSATNEGAMVEDDEGEWIIDFGEHKADGSMNWDLTKGGKEFDVFATLKAIIQKFIKEKDPKIINFSAAKDAKNNRARVYAKLFKKNLPSGWELDTDNDPSDINVFFRLVKEDLT